MLRMDQVHVIQHKVLVEGQSVRRVARELGLSRCWINKYLRQSEPVRRRRARERPVWEQVKPRLDELMAEWEPRTTAKQRLTGTRIQRQHGAPLIKRTIYISTGIPARPMSPPRPEHSRAVTPGASGRVHHQD
jgi:hypothetical protein